MTAPIYQDYTGTVFQDMTNLAEYRIKHPAPQLGGAICPAVEYTFAVSDDGGQTWRNPTELTKAALREAVLNQPGCCRNLAGQCPTVANTDQQQP